MKKLLEKELYTIIIEENGDVTLKCNRECPMQAPLISVYF